MSFRCKGVSHSPARTTAGLCCSHREGTGALCESVLLSSSESVLLSCSNSPSWPSRSRGLVSVVPTGKGPDRGFGVPDEFFLSQGRDFHLTAGANTPGVCPARTQRAGPGGRDAVSPLSRTRCEHTRAGCGWYVLGHKWQPASIVGNSWQSASLGKRPSTPGNLITSRATRSQHSKVAQDQVAQYEQGYGNPYKKQTEGGRARGRK